MAHFGNSEVNTSELLFSNDVTHTHTNSKSSLPDIFKTNLLYRKRHKEQINVLVPNKRRQQQI